MSVETLVHPEAKEAHQLDEFLNILAGQEGTQFKREGNRYIFRISFLTHPERISNTVDALVQLKGFEQSIDSVTENHVTVVHVFDDPKDQRRIEVALDPSNIKRQIGSLDDPSPKVPEKFKRGD